MNRFCKSLALLLVTSFVVTHRLLAPIQEVPESPTPAPEQSAKPKPMRVVQPKEKEDSESSKRKKTPQPQVRATPNSAPFAGTWSGTMNITLFGDIGYTFLIDPGQTAVTMWGTNKPSEIPHTHADVCRATVTVDGISWNWSAWKWTLKPYPNGKSALVKVAGPFQNGSAVFERQK